MRIPVVRRVLERNEQAAAANRRRCDAHGVRCVNLLGGAGCGKTSLLEAALPRLGRSTRLAVLEGDPATTRDARRIQALGLPVVQLLTGGGCHLEATHVARALERLELARLDLLVIENVGNPICPASFDLGEHLRIGVLSVAEGHDKPAKYPLLFRRADLLVISKCDLLPHVAFDLRIAETDLRRLNRSAEILHTDLSSGRGIARLAAWLRGDAGPARRR